MRYHSCGRYTNSITAKGSPSLGGVFKLVGQYDGDAFVPKIKMSDNAEKISNPGIKNVLRIYDKKTGKMKADIIALEGETIDPTQDLHLTSDKAPWRSRMIPANSFEVKTMLQPIFLKGKLVYDLPSLSDIIAYADEQMDSFWPEYQRLVNPEEMWVQRSAKVSALREKVLKEESLHFF